MAQISTLRALSVFGVQPGGGVTDRVLDELMGPHDGDAQAVGDLPAPESSRPRLLGAR